MVPLVGRGPGRGDREHVPADLTVDVEGVRTTAQRLATLAGVEAFDDGVLVELLSREFLWIPSTAFAGRGDRERFVRHVLERAPLPDPAL